MRRVVIAVIVLLALVLAGGVGFVAYRLTDAKLTESVTTLLNENFTGKFLLDGAHYSFPASVEIHDLTVKTPEGETVLTLGEVRAVVSVRSLLGAKVVIDELVVANLQVDLHVPPGGGKPPLLVALNPEFELPDIQDIHTPVRIELMHARIEEVNVKAHGEKGLRARLNHVEVSEVGLWMHEDMIGITLTVTGAGWMRGKDETVRVPDLQVHVEDARLRFSSLEGWAQKLEVKVPGIEAEVHGYVQADNVGLTRATAQGHVRLDTENAVLRPQLPEVIRGGLRGAANLKFSGKLEGEDAQGTLSTSESRFEVRAIPIKELTAEVERHGSRVKVTGFKLGLADGWLKATGTATVRDGKAIEVGEHQIEVKAHALPIRGLVGQFVELSALLPQSLSLALTLYGRSLWPPTGTMDLNTVVEGLPGEDWPGLPRAVEVRARFLTHPDLIEILRMGVAIDKLPSFAIQGALPMNTDSALELLQALHSANPLKGLHRIPVAPSTERPPREAPP